VLGWPKRCKLAQALLWEDSHKKLKLAQLLGRLGVFLTLLAHSATGASLTPRLHVWAQSSETRRLQPRYSVLTGPAIFSNPKARDEFIVPDGVPRRRRPVLMVGIGTLAVSTDCESAEHTLPTAASSAPEQCSCGIPDSSAHCIRRRPVLVASQPTRSPTVERGAAGRDTLAGREADGVLDGKHPVRQILDLSLEV
jgi:hypothetical protein